MKEFSFEKLTVWQEARQLLLSIYKQTEAFPKSEMYGMTSQLRRASLSVCSNLAEGSSRVSPKDQARFYTIAYSSLIEALNQLIICADLNYIQNEYYETSRKNISDIAMKIGALKNKTLNHQP